jgi:uncharacterized protein YqjF (DUF2071 family)
MHQRWHDLLFAHWPVPADDLNALMPATLPVDTFDGQAWVAVVPFRMSGVRLRGVPPVPLTSALLELNVRTYVTINDEPGVYFFSLDAENRLAVEVARSWFKLPYFNAGMTLQRRGGWIHYASHRTDNRGRPALFSGRYRPTGEPLITEPGTLEYWLTERYALYTTDGDGRIYRGRIHHPRWPLQPAEAVFTHNTVAQSHGITLPDTPPLLHFSESIAITAGAIQRVG